VRELGCTSWVERCKERGVGRREREPARGGGEEQAGLGWKLGLLSYFLSFFFFKPTQIYLISNQI
jgi:hypothetical protein